MIYRRSALSIQEIYILVVPAACSVDYFISDKIAVASMQRLIETPLML